MQKQAESRKVVRQYKEQGYFKVSHCYDFHIPPHYLEVLKGGIYRFCQTPESLNARTVYADGKPGDFLAPTSHNQPF